MKFSISQTLFADALGLVVPASTTQSTLPYYALVEVQASAENFLRLTCTSGPVMISRKVSAVVDVPGVVRVLASELHKWADSVSDAQISAEVADGFLNLRGGRSKVRFALGTDFANTDELIDLGSTTPFFTVDPERLIAALTVGLTSVAPKGHSMPVLEGVFFDAQRDLVLYSTDGYRMTRLDLAAQVQRSAKLIVHNSLIKQIKRAFDGAEAKEIVVTLSANQAHMLLTDGDIIVRVSLMSDTYPAVQELVPDYLDSKFSFIELEQEELVAACKRATLFARHETSKSVFIAFLSLDLAGDDVPFDDAGDLIIRSSSDEVGSVREALPASVEGEPWTFTINLAFLLDAVNKMDSGVVRLTKCDGEMLVVTSAGGEGHILHTIMGMNFYVEET